MSYAAADATCSDLARALPPGASVNPPLGARPLVLIIVWRLSVGGGVQTVLRSVLAGLSQDRYDTHVLVVRPPLEEDRLTDFPHATFHTLGLPRSSRVGLLTKVRLSLRMSLWVCRLRPNVVHLQSGTSMYAALGTVLTRTRVKLLDVHDAPRSGRHGRASDWLEGQLIRRGRHIAVAHSTSVQADLRTHYGLVDEQMRLVPLGVGTGHFAGAVVGAQEWRLGAGLPSEALVVVYLAQLRPTKNVPLFLEVMADVIAADPDSPIHGVVISGGSDRDRLTALADDLGLAGRAHLITARTEIDLVDAYRAADVFLSTSDYEGFGLAIVEAMAAGVPVVSTAVGGVTDTVEDEVTGFLRPRGDRAGLAEAVTRLLRDPELRQRMGAAGRARAESRFTAAHMVQGYLDVYGEARR